MPKIWIWGECPSEPFIIHKGHKRLKEVLLKELLEAVTEIYAENWYYCDDKIEGELEQEMKARIRSVFINFNYD